MALLTIGVAIGVYIYNKKIHLKKNNLQDSGSTHKPLESPSTVNKNRGNPTDVAINSASVDDLNSSYKEHAANSSYEGHDANNSYEEQSSNNVYVDCSKNTSATIKEGAKQMKSSENNSTPKSIEEQKQEQKSGFFSTIFKPVSNLFGSESSTKDIAKDASPKTIMNTEIPSKENPKTQQIPSEENPETQKVPSKVDEKSVMTKEEELKDMFGKIYTTYDNDYIPNDYISDQETQKNILKCFNEVIIEEVYENSKPKHVTLNNLLIELSEIQEESNDILHIDLSYVTFKCPPLFKEDKYMHRLLLGYYNRKNGSLDKLKIEGFSLTDKDSGVFSFSELLRSINNLCLENTVVSIDLLRAISEMKNLQVLELGKQTKILEDSTPELNLSNIQKLYMHDIDSTSAQKILQSLGPRDKYLELYIRSINFIPSSIINNIKCLDKIKIFDLSNTTIEKEPDFGFLEKMKSLHTLKLYKIMYSSTEELNEENINEIQEKVDLLNPTLQQLDEKNDLPNNGVSLLAENNMKIGAQLTASRICVDGKLYNDLGLSKLKVKEHANIDIIFYILIQDGYRFFPYNIMFSIDKKTKIVEIKPGSDIEACEAITNALQGIPYPFTECSDVETICMRMRSSGKVKAGFADMFLSKIFEYSGDTNTVKNICIESNKLYEMSKDSFEMFSEKFKEVLRLELKNISLTVSEKFKENTETGLDKQTGTSYEKVNDSTKDYLFERKSKTDKFEMVEPK
ncbi:uncharacterized protein NESG_02244 [Nematocida ausubeli]|uniref:Uncharacterized protein n=1 Tax=Nematocida ausubeli (strain ATCC PRA-371 / ERTm2) TaxID=1913371 RepID=A0A086J001_NEMA1|nr:uncharacterized protein NESG_02244 [Nematocida ausubeli]KAI5132034.1 hypothetical protein NEAUS07_0033 [Nematocida ausubeli]KAI5132809.1 hypothetical protein NEAUS06_0355 [Nematocida ausubeli]KFG25469.1 hypothetical protein NESG_02244 [Nematocida ausubeli]